MRRVLLAFTLAVSCVPLPTQAGDDLLARAAAVNPSLHSYMATMHAHVALKSFPFLSTDLSGTYYHKDPNKDKLEITSGLPGLAKQFSKLYPHLVTPAQWADIFDVSKTSDDGKLTTYKLVPKKRGNIDHIDATISDKDAVVTSMTWHYYNGGTASMNNSYSVVDGNQVVTAQTGSVDEPAYKGDIDTKLDNYKLNPSISDSIFQEQ